MSLTNQPALSPAEVGSHPYLSPQLGHLKLLAAILDP